MWTASAVLASAGANDAQARILLALALVGLDQFLKPGVMSFAPPLLLWALHREARKATPTAPAST